MRLERRLLVQMSRHRFVFAFLFLATGAACYALVRLAGGGAFHAAARPDWKLLAAGFAICAAVQPLRALAWSSTVRHPVGFRAIYASSSIGSFLDTVLPGRLGVAAKRVFGIVYVDGRVPIANLPDSADAVARQFLEPWLQSVVRRG